MSLVYIVYVSSAVCLMNEAELDQLLRQARENNARHNITGMLLYKDGGFIQAIEGEAADVLRLHDKIAADARHKNFITLLKGTSSERNFSGWSMAFTNINSMNQSERDGFSPFLDTPFAEDYFGKHPHRALKLLLLFKKSYDRG